MWHDVKMEVYDKGAVGLCSRGLPDMQLDWSGIILPSRWHEIHVMTICKCNTVPKFTHA